MDDFIIDYFEGGFDYDYHYDHDLHRDLDIELGNGYNDGPFAALADAVDLIPDYDYENDYDVEYHGGSEQGRDLGDIGLDDQSASSESSVPDSIDHSIESDTASESLHDRHDRSSDQDSEEEGVQEHYGIPFQGHQHISSDESEESDYGSLPSSEDDRNHEYSENGQAEDYSQDEENSQISDDDEAHPPSVRWDPVAEARDEGVLSHLRVVDGIHQDLDHFTDDEVFDDFSDDEVLGNHYDVDLDSSSEGQGSERIYDGEDSLRSRSQDEDNHAYSDDEASISGDSANSPRSSPASPSEGPFIPPSPPRAFFPHRPREFDALHNEIAHRQRQRQRLQEDLRRLRQAHLGIPRADVPNGIDYFLDWLPAPQRDAHGLLAQMEMDLERGRQQRRRAAPSPIRAPPRPQQRQQREPAAVIDLTGDSDNEVLALPDAPRFGGRPSGNRDANPFAPRDQNRNNPRRNNPARRAPSFARSDGSFLGPGAAPVIDLTNDAPEADPPPPPRLAPRRRRPVDQHNNEGQVDRARANAWGAANMNAIFRQMGIPRMGVDFLQQMRVALGGGQADYEVEFIGENIRADQPHFPMMENPLADNPVEFNYGGNGFNHEPAARPKPAHIAPPEPREGFTRNTGEDTVAICPSCEEELKYDPDENDGQPPPAKKARTTKKDREEHHFWAVKACGHVSIIIIIISLDKLL